MQGKTGESYCGQTAYLSLILDGSTNVRRGNCWDNAPIESFFGHMKAEINLESCHTLDDVIREIKSYITYYNNHRPS